MGNFCVCLQLPLKNKVVCVSPCRFSWILCRASSQNRPSNILHGRSAVVAGPGGERKAQLLVLTVVVVVGAAAARDVAEDARENVRTARFVPIVAVTA